MKKIIFFSFSIVLLSFISCKSESTDNGYTYKDSLISVYKDSMEFYKRQMKFYDNKCDSILKENYHFRDLLTKHVDHIFTIYDDVFVDSHTGKRYDGIYELLEEEYDLYDLCEEYRNDSYKEGYDDAKLDSYDSDYDTYDGDDDDDYIFDPRGRR